MAVARVGKEMSDTIFFHDPNLHFREDFLGVMTTKVMRKRTKKIRSIKTESAAVRKAVDLIAFQKEVMQGYGRAAGRLGSFAPI